jgi:hypothetical protein
MADDGYEGPARRMSRHQSTDEGRLAELGYKQELKRDWSMLHNFGVSFSIIVCYLFLQPIHCLRPNVSSSPSSLE